MSFAHHRLPAGRRFAALLALAVAAPSVAHAAPQYMIYSAGLYDASTSPGSHIGSSGASNTISSFNSAGAITGTATRFVSSSVTNTLGVNAWYYNPITHATTIIGLVAPYSSTATSNTEQDGLESSAIRGIASNGVVAGTSAFYSNSATATGGSANLGNGAWSFDPATGVTTPIGYFDLQPSGTAGHIRSNGLRASSVTAINSAGQSVGVSSRYDGTISEGQDAWIYSNGQTTSIGLIGGIWTSTTDPELHSSAVSFLNGNGQASGTSSRYDVSLTNSAWFFDGSTTILIGLNSAPYTSSSLTFGQMNNVVVTGVSNNSAFSNTAWVYNIANNTTTPVTLTGASPGTSGRVTYTGSTVNTFGSSTVAINALGQAIGTQKLYLASSNTTAGTEAYIFDGTSSVVIGLTDAVHTANPATSANVVRTNTASYLNDSGQVAGTSAIFATTGSTTTNIGTDAWVYTLANGTNIVGLTTPLYTNSVNSAHSSSVNAQNSSGLIAGTSTRYTSAGTTAGSDAYLYTPGAAGALGTSAVIGLTDALHTSSDGVNKGSTIISAITNTGFVAGTSTRFSSTATNGQDAWLWDANTSTPYQITPSVNGSTNAASSSITYLDPSGVVLGTYTKYDPTTSANLGTFTYGFSETLGTFDLGLSTTNLATADWAKLASLFASFSLNGDITGTGTRISIAGTSAYLLSPIHTWIATAPTTSWDSAANWSDGIVPNSISALATVGSSGAGANLILTTPKTVNTLTFNGNFSSTISGAPLTIMNSVVVAGTQTISAPVILGATTTFGGAGTLTLSSTVSGPGTLVMAGPGTLVLSGTPAYTGGTSITGGKLLTTGFSLPAPASGPNVTVFAGGTYALADTTATLHTAPISLANAAFASYLNVLPGGKFTPGNNDLILTGGATAELSTNLLLTTPQMVTVGSSSVYVTTGLLSGAELATLTGSPSFDGVAIAGGDLIARYGLAGDVNFSGMIDIDDYLAIDSGIAQSLLGYSNGDFNHDGAVNAADYALIDWNFLQQSGSLADGEIALHAGEFGQAYTEAFSALGVSAVPEPASLLLLGFGSAAILRRRRR